MKSLLVAIGLVGATAQAFTPAETTAICEQAFESFFISNGTDFQCLQGESAGLPSTQKSSFDKLCQDGFPHYETMLRRESDYQNVHGTGAAASMKHTSNVFQENVTDSINSTKLSGTQWAQAKAAASDALESAGYAYDPWAAFHDNAATVCGLPPVKAEGTAKGMRSSCDKQTTLCDFVKRDLPERSARYTRWITEASQSEGAALANANALKRYGGPAAAVGAAALPAALLPLFMGGKDSAGGKKSKPVTSPEIVTIDPTAPPGPGLDTSADGPSAESGEKAEAALADIGEEEKGLVGAEKEKDKTESRSAAALASGEDKGSGARGLLNSSTNSRAESEGGVAKSGGGAGYRGVGSGSSDDDGAPGKAGSATHAGSLKNRKRPLATKPKAKIVAKRRGLVGTNDENIVNCRDPASYARNKKRCEDATKIKSELKKDPLLQ